jgi:hypothetical protein
LGRSATEKKIYIASWNLINSEPYFQITSFHFVIYGINNIMSYIVKTILGFKHFKTDYVQLYIIIIQGDQKFSVHLTITVHLQMHRDILYMTRFNASGNISCDSNNLFPNSALILSK